MINGQPLPDSPESATMDLHVESDITDLVVTTRPGATISGRIVFADAPPPVVPGEPDPITQLRVSATSPPQGMPFGINVPPTQVSRDLTFTLKGMAGPVIIRANALPRNFIIKQVLVGSEDITDRPHEFTERESGELQVVITSRTSGLEGTLTDNAGKPALDAIVVVMPDSAEARRGLGSGIYRTGSPDPRGHYRMMTMRPGRYLIAVVSRDAMPRGPNNTDAIEEIAKDAKPITLGEGEFQVLDLKFSGGGGA